MSNVGQNSKISGMPADVRANFRAAIADLKEQMRPQPKMTYKRNYDKIIKQNGRFYKEVVLVKGRWHIR